MLRSLTCVFATTLLACGPSPENPGDECDPDDGCPNGMVCAPGAGTEYDHACFLPLGQACVAAEVDPCLDPGICSPFGLCELPVGAACTEGVDNCIGDAECVEGICGLPPGAPCNPAAVPDECAGDLLCDPDPEDATVGTCAIGEGGECDPEEPYCTNELTCAELEAGGHACFPPVTLIGSVFDSETEAGIEEAQVLALDDQKSAVSDIAVTDATGNYELEVPVARDAEGMPVGGTIFTLRSSAQDYQDFPGGLRTALPIVSDEAMASEGGWTIDTAVTDIAMIALPSEEQGRPSISGTVLADDGAAGVLVVAEGATAHVGVSDLAGAYTIFNVPDGSFTVNGYAAGLQLAPESVTMAGAALTEVDLSESGEALGAISGSVNIVNAPGGSATSVVLVVDSTFDDTFVRGEVPRGLRSPLSGPPDVTSSFTIEGVPAGTYKVLAAFENDDLVRDPDPNIAGTQIVTVDMPAPGQDVALDASFKVTEALEVVAPGVDEPEAVSAPPLLTWADDSSEDFYTVVVYDAYGDLVWCLSDQLPNCDGPNVPSVSGNDNVEVPYGGPMETGMYYQFRATSWRSPGGNPGPIATTEDLRGVFYVQ